MKDSSRTIPNYLSILILFLLLVPFILGSLKIEILPLKGAITKVENKKININDWFSGVYQTHKEEYLNESFGIRSFFIRINNQIAYSLFNQAKVNGIIVGKNNYLFDVNYINAYCGGDFIGTDSITNRLHQLKFIQDTLSKLNKNIFLVFAPGKGSFYSEFIPEQYKTKKGLTNYSFYTKTANELGINCIDFNKYFIGNKYKSKYPLYPQYGIHWSIYGSWIVADSIIKYIEKVRNIDMPDFVCKNIILSQPREADYDIAGGMNLLFKLRSFNMADPQIELVEANNKIKPSLLVISDSFYWLLMRSEFIKAFGENQFWYYNNEVNPCIDIDKLLTVQLNLKDEILNKDVIIIMATEATLPELGWGFIEDAYNTFKGLETRKSTFTKKELDKKIQLRLEKIVQSKISDIKNDEKWMESIKHKAASKNITVDSMLRLDALWLIEN